LKINFETSLLLCQAGQHRHRQMPGMPAGSELTVSSTEHQSRPDRSVRFVRGTTSSLIIEIQYHSSRGRTLVSQFDFGIDNKSVFTIRSLAVLRLNYHFAPDRISPGISPGPAWIFSRVVRPAAFMEKLIISLIASC